MRIGLSMDFIGHHDFFDKINFNLPYNYHYKHAKTLKELEKSYNDFLDEKYLMQKEYHLRIIKYLKERDYKHIKQYADRILELDEYYHKASNLIQIAQVFHRKGQHSRKVKT